MKRDLKNVEASSSDRENQVIHYLRYQPSHHMRQSQKVNKPVIQSLKERLYYAIDNSLSKGTAHIIFWLFIILVLIVLAMASLVWITGVSPEESLIDQIGIFAKTVAKYNYPSNEALIFNLATFILFITGLFVSGALIGALTTGLSNKLAEIRSGHSHVIETGHTVILGWSSHIFSIISELVIANENQSRSCVVIF